MDTRSRDYSLPAWLIQVISILVSSMRHGGGSGSGGFGVLGTIHTNMSSQIGEGARSRNPLG